MFLGSHPFNMQLLVFIKGRVLTGLRWEPLFFLITLMSKDSCVTTDGLLVIISCMAPLETPI